MAYAFGAVVGGAFKFASAIFDIGSLGNSSELLSAGDQVFMDAMGASASRIPRIATPSTVSTGNGLLAQQMAQSQNFRSRGVLGNPFILGRVGQALLAGDPAKAAGRKERARLDAIAENYRAPKRKKVTA